VNGLRLGCHFGAATTDTFSFVKPARLVGLRVRFVELASDYQPDAFTYLTKKKTRRNRPGQTFSKEKRAFTQGNRRVPHRIGNGYAFSVAHKYKQLYIGADRCTIETGNVTTKEKKPCVE